MGILVRVLVSVGGCWIFTKSADLLLVTMNITSVNYILEYYQKLWNIRDKRVDGWFMMNSPWPTISLCTGYIYITTVLGPSIMKERAKPFDLKKTIMAYNLLQVVFSGYVLFEACMAGWLTGYNWLCQDIDRDTDPNSKGMRMTRVCWLYFLGKFLEFLDTFFFLARKKFEHVSSLQIIHHSVMPLYGYVMVRWLPGGHETFGGTLNSLVHVFMYGYYFLAALGPGMKKYLWWKKYLTIFQMIQFVIVFVRSLLVIFGIVDCGYPRYFSLISASITALFFAMFMKFYSKSYQAKQKLKNN